MAEPLAYSLFRAASTSAWHMELRDSYTPADPDWLDWQAGKRFDPAERWSDWSDLVRATVARGVGVRRVRIVSEPVTDYIRFEYDVTAAHNIAAGEQVRWLPRLKSVRAAGSRERLLGVRRPGRAVEITSLATAHG